MRSWSWRRDACAGRPWMECGSKAAARRRRVALLAQDTGCARKCRTWRRCAPFDENSRIELLLQFRAEAAQLLAGELLAEGARRGAEMRPEGPREDRGRGKAAGGRHLLDR